MSPFYFLVVVVVVDFYATSTAAASIKTTRSTTAKKARKTFLSVLILSLNLSVSSLMQTKRSRRLHLACTREKDNKIC